MKVNLNIGEEMKKREVWIEKGKKLKRELKGEKWFIFKVLRLK